MLLVELDDVLNNFPIIFYKISPNKSISLFNIIVGFYKKVADKVADKFNF